MNQNAIDALLARKSLLKAPVNATRAANLMKKAKHEIAAVSKIAETSEEIAYTAAYEAIFKATLALMAILGFRPGKAEQRKAAVDFSRAALPSGFENPLAAYDKIRQKRNDLSYELATVTRTDLDQAIKQGVTLIEAIGQEVAAASAKSRKK